MTYRAFANRPRLEVNHRVKFIFSWRKMKFNRSRLKKMVLSKRSSLLEDEICVKEKLKKSEIQRNQSCKELPKYAKTTDLEPINLDWSIFFVTSPPVFMRIEL